MAKLIPTSCDSPKTIPDRLPHGIYGSDALSKAFLNTDIKLEILLYAEGCSGNEIDQLGRYIAAHAIVPEENKQNFLCILAAIYLEKRKPGTLAAVSLVL